MCGVIEGLFFGHGYSKDTSRERDKTMALLKMIAIENGYAIVDEHEFIHATFPIYVGQPILHDVYTDPKCPETRSIFLRGVLALQRANGN